MLCGDIVKDDSGAYEGSTEQDSSASQITAAKVMAVYQVATDKQLMQDLPTLA